MNRAARRQLKREGLVCEHGHVKKTDSTGTPLCPHRCGFVDTPRRYALKSCLSCFNGECPGHSREAFEDERRRWARWAIIVGGVGLGVCETCQAPGAFWYPAVVPTARYGGIWMCDSCVHPDRPRERIGAHLAIIRGEVTA